MKREEDEDIKPHLSALQRAVKQEGAVELLDDDDDSDTPPDYPVTDPRYAAWVNRKQSSLPQNFQPYLQKTHKPFFEVKSHQQASIGPLILGKDPHQGNKNVQVPASINRFLRNYQRDGVKFFWKHYAKGEGGLLGDDMGLGKTIQVISFLTAIMGKPHNNSCKLSDYEAENTLVRP
jgi:SNF2 family DNA or RNA helicase